MIAMVWAAPAEAEPIEVLEGLELALHGFVDAGWFDVEGNGASYRFDHTETSDGTWVYTGDPWASAINTQGDPADLGNDFDNLQREDPIASGGRPSFIVNTVELATTLRGDHIDADVALWLEPRTGEGGSLGDLASLDRAIVTWHPRDDRSLELRIGKLESVFGVEWYQRRAPDRPNITPSLIARYTTGTPTGLGLHMAPGRHLRLDAQVTNGGTTTERFGHFENELDTNGVPTGTVHADVLPLRRPVVRLGVSGQVGAQDGVVEIIPMWQVGADLSIDLTRFYVRAEVLRSDQDQGEPGEVDRLVAGGFMVQVWAHVLPWCAPVLRLDRRDALMEIASVGNRYESDVLRLSAAIRLDPTYNLAVRAEFSHLWELWGEPIDDDVIATSVVFRW